MISKTNLIVIIIAFLIIGASFFMLFASNNQTPKPATNEQPGTSTLLEGIPQNDIEKLEGSNIPDAFLSAGQKTGESTDFYDPNNRVTDFAQLLVNLSVEATMEKYLDILDSENWTVILNDKMPNGTPVITAEQGGSTVGLQFEEVNSSATYVKIFYKQN